MAIYCSQTLFFVIKIFILNESYIAGSWISGFSNNISHYFSEDEFKPKGGSDSSEDESSGVDEEESSGPETDSDYGSPIKVSSGGDEEESDSGSPM